MRNTLSLLALFLLLSGTARAADAPFDAAGAEKLKKQIEESLKWRLDMAKNKGEGITLGGPVTVTPKDGFYDVQLPQAAVLMKDRGRLDIGTISMKAMPDGAPNAWRLETTLPATLTLRDTADAVAATVTIGRQHITSTWISDKGIYPKVDTLLEDIKAANTGKDGITVDIGSIKAWSDLKDNGDNTWSGPVNFDAGTIKARRPGDAPLALSIRGLSSHTQYDKVDLTQAIAQRNEIQKTVSASGGKLSAKQRKELAASLFKKAPSFSGNVDAVFTVSKFLLEGTRPESKRSFSFDTFTASGTTTSLSGDKIKMLVKAAATGLAFAPQDETLLPLTPQKFNIEVTFDNVPIKALMSEAFSIMSKAIDRTPVDGGDKKALRQQNAQDLHDAFADVPKMMQDAGTVMTIDNTSLSTGGLDISAAGKINAKAASPRGIVGNVTVSVKGLDEEVDKLKADLLNPEKTQAIGAFGVVSALQAKGQPGKSATGASLRNYTLDFSDDGRILLNGADIAATPAATKAKAGGPAPDSTQKPMVVPPAGKKPAAAPAP